MQFPVPFFVTLTIPTNAGVGAARIVLDGVHGAILVYNNSPQGKGSLVYSLSAVNFTDPYGNQVQSLQNMGQWSVTTGQMAAHLGVDPNGNVYIVDSNGMTRCLISNGSAGFGNQVGDPGIAFFNAFGAALLVVDPARGGTFQYADNNSAVQGGLIGAQAGKTTNDPVLGNLTSPGFHVINPVFGDSTVVVGSITSIFNLNFNNPAKLAPSGGNPSGATGPSLNVFAPFQTATNVANMALFGQSPDLTVDAGLVIVKDTAQNQPVKKTSALLEVQGLITALMASSGLTAFMTEVVGDAFSRFTIDSNGLHHWGSGSAASDISLFREAAAMLGLNASLALQLQSSAPSTVASFGQLYLDSLTQLHTDRAFVTDGGLSVALAALIGGALTATGGTINTPSLVTTDTWHAIPGIAGNGWSTVAGQPIPSYRMQADGMVHVCAAATHAAFSGTTAFSTALPAAYRPATTIVQAANNGTSIEITSGGIINIIPSGSQTAFQCSIRYPVDL